jgi:type IV pilus assembly protein PilE
MIKQAKPMRLPAKGFTLIEVMIVLVIIAILAAVAVPSYRSYLIRSQRTDATSALLKLAAAQEKFFLQNNTYAPNSALATAPPNGLGLTGTDNGFYTLEILSEADAATALDSDCPIASCWVATATPVSTGPQANDSDCTLFQITSLGDRTAKKGSTANPDCWRR